MKLWDSVWATYWGIKFLVVNGSWLSVVRGFNVLKCVKLSKYCSLKLSVGPWILHVLPQTWIPLEDVICPWSTYLLLVIPYTLLLFPHPPGLYIVPYLSVFPWQSLCFIRKIKPPLSLLLHAPQHVWFTMHTRQMSSKDQNCLIIYVCSILIFLHPISLSQRTFNDYISSRLAFSSLEPQSTSREANMKII